MQNPYLLIRILNHSVNFVLVIFLAFIVTFAMVFITSSGEVARESSAVKSSEVNVKSNSSSVLIDSFDEMIDHAGKASSATFNKIGNAASTAANTVGGVLLNIAKFIGKIISTVLSAVFNVIKTIVLFFGKVIGWIIDKIIVTPLRAVGSVANIPVISSRIAPAQQIENIAIIDPESPEIKEALQAINDQKKEEVTALHKKNSKTIWPVKGRITTQFGVPHYPYQPVHSGIDISDSTAPGVTPVRPFRSGVVLKVVRSNYGLGNYVIVDHGNDITSVYAHLDSISVVEYMDVDTSTELGRQGTTGASTGTHLHFEIRINGKATDPIPFLSE